MSDAGIGARLLRKEDDRHLEGRGQFVGDLAMPGLREVAFLRSPIAHGRLKSIGKPAGRENAVMTAAELGDAKPIRANSGIPGFRASDYPLLATDKVRFVGEPIALCFAQTRAEAEDLAEAVVVDLEELPAVHDMLQGRSPDAPRVHDDWPDNLFLETNVPGDLAAIAAEAEITVTREYRTARQVMTPMEGKAVLAHWDDRRNQLVVYTSTQVPHMIRTGLAEFLGIDQGFVRVIAPDVGGGFGYKCVLQPEEVLIAWLALTHRRPFRWTEDRREHLTAGANCRQHYYKITAYADANGRLLGLDGDVSVDVGAYSVYPFTACLEAAQAGGNLPGPYAFDHYTARTYSVATNKPPFAPYRGVARPGVCFAMELTIDAIARAAGRDPFDVRLENLVPAAAMPYDNVTGKHYDSGDFPESLRRAADALGLAEARERQKQPLPDGRRLGIGFSTYTEQTAHGTKVFASWGIPLVPGFEQATARVTPDGGLELRVGVQSHGQGMETTLAQIATTVLGLDPARIAVVHGDTALTPYSTGTYASRSIVMAGGAVSEACGTLAGRIRRIGAHLLQCPTEDTTLSDGGVSGPAGRVSLAEIARVWYLRPEQLPDDVDPAGLEATVGFKPKVDTGAFSYASHAALVAVDTETGDVEILDYVIVEDCGTLVNPMVVEGQTQGGTAQGIGTALFEEVNYDAGAQPSSSTLADYLLPGAAEVPSYRMFHMETPSPYTAFGIKGVGEGGAIAPAGAIVNAINDALAPLGVEITEIPATPRRVLQAILEAAQ